MLAAAVPVVAAAGVVVAVVLGGGALLTTPGPSAPVAPLAAASAPVPSWLREAAASGPLAGVAADASDAVSDAVSDAARHRRAESDQQQRGGAGVCDLQGPPRFDDPAHPNEITNRDCGYVDARGRERSRDPWIDGQLLSSYGE